MDDLDNDELPMHREAKALQRLKDYGLSDKGYAPHFHGIIRKLDPKFVLPGLLDPIAVYAILLEYIPDIQQLSTKMYTREHWEKGLEILKLIHKAGMLHDDASQHNAVVAGSGDERILWLDFSMSTTFDEESGQTQWQQQQMMEKEEIVVAIGKGLVRLLSYWKNHGRSNILQERGQAEGLEPW